MPPERSARAVLSDQCVSESLGWYVQPCSHLSAQRVKCSRQLWGSLQDIGGEIVLAAKGRDAPSGPELLVLRLIERKPFDDLQQGPLFSAGQEIGLVYEARGSWRVGCAEQRALLRDNVHNGYSFLRRLQSSLLIPAFPPHSLLRRHTTPPRRGTLLGEEG